ncbi:MAG: DoxX family protein [Muribaculaceae bacterium]|nr:DoxX family protein [Muribaculaceae bacterium]
MTVSAKHPASTVALVWILRVVIGAVFIISGFAKADDLYGFIFKVEEYLQVWGWSQPRSLVIIGTMGLSGIEFVLGCMLLLGCYKRTSVWLMLAMMAFMLPLTAYIYIADPVPDCGCFGDFIVLSNGATFLKNIFITAALVYLAVCNKKVPGLFGPYIQWLVITVCSLYIIIIGVYGYVLQPLVDFRSFAVGTSLVADDAEEEDAEFEFIYEKEGIRKTFSQDNLPDSSWTFVDRRQLNAQPTSKTEFAILDNNENITEEVIATEGEQLLILIPDYDRADVSNTYVLNLLADYVRSQGGSIVSLIAADKNRIEEWKDLSMADYPVYYAEPTLLKELARGIMPAVYLRDGTIVWKRTTTSIDPDILEKAAGTPGVLDTLALDGYSTLRNLTATLVIILAVLFLLDRSGRLLKWSIMLRKKAEKLK